MLSGPFALPPISDGLQGQSLSIAVCVSVEAAVLTPQSPHLFLSHANGKTRLQCRVFLQADSQNSMFSSAAPANQCFSTGSSLDAFWVHGEGMQRWKPG